MEFLKYETKYKEAVEKFFDMFVRFFSVSHQISSLQCDSVTVPLSEPTRECTSKPGNNYHHQKHLQIREAQNVMKKYVKYSISSDSSVTVSYRLFGHHIESRVGGSVTIEEYVLRSKSYTES